MIPNAVCSCFSQKKTKFHFDNCNDGWNLNDRVKSAKPTATSPDKSAIECTTKVMTSIFWYAYGILFIEQGNFEECGPICKERVWSFTKTVYHVTILARVTLRIASTLTLLGPQRLLPLRRFKKLKFGSIFFHVSQEHNISRYSVKIVTGKSY